MNNKTTNWSTTRKHIRVSGVPWRPDEDDDGDDDDSPGAKCPKLFRSTTLGREYSTRDRSNSDDEAVCS